MPGLSAKGTGKGTHLPVSFRKGFDCLVSQLLPEGSASDQPASRCYYSPLQSSREPVGTFLTFSLWLSPTVKPSLQLLPGRSLFTHLVYQLLWLAPEE